MPLRQENDFRFDLDEFKAGLSDKTKLVILNSPANPTGGVLTPEDIAGLADILRDRPDIMILSDEIYSRLLYSGEFASIASEPGMADERTIILDGFSKTYAMTGWRLGYGVMPNALAEAGRETAGQLELLRQRRHPVGRDRGDHRAARQRGARCWPSSAPAAI